jgi:hypothetical protein
MPTYDLTSADNGRQLAANPGSITSIQVPANRGTSGRFSLTDPVLNAARGFSQPLVAIDVDYPAPVALTNNNSESTTQPIPQCNLLGAACSFSSLICDSVPLNGTWRVILA